MASDLFNSACEQLDDVRKASLVDFLNSLHTAGTNGLGAILWQNLHDESHLVGAAGWGDTTALREFLLSCIGKWTGTASSVIAEYVTACGEHELYGLPIKKMHLPNQLLRYTESRYFVAALLETLVSPDAKVDFTNRILTDAEAVRLLAGAWVPAELGRAGLRLSPPWKKSTFATFEDIRLPQPQRADARLLAAALGLRCAQVPNSMESLYGFAYARDMIGEWRFPTVADAANYELFRPSPENPPTMPPAATCWGCTGPLLGQQAQPELVHNNASADVLLSPIVYVGRLG